METLITLVEVEQITSLKKSKLYELMGEGKFPRPVPITEKRRAWPASEVQKWVEGRIAARDSVHCAHSGEPLGYPCNEETGLSGKNTVGDTRKGEEYGADLCEEVAP